MAWRGVAAEGLEFAMGGPWLGERSDTRVVWEGLEVGPAEVQDDGGCTGVP